MRGFAPWLSRVLIALLLPLSLYVCVCQCTDLILSSLAGLFGAKLIVATHTPQAYALFTEPQPAAVSPAAASTGGAAIPPPMNPLAHILRVVDCSSANFASDGAVLAAVMEETGGLGVDGVIDLQHTHDPWNFLHMQHVTFTGDQSKEAVSVVDASADDGADDDAAAAASDDAAASAVDSSSGGLVDVTSGLVPLSASLSAAPLTPSNPISLPTLIACLGVHGRLLTSTPNLQLDPPLSRQLFLRGASVAFLFPHSWLLGATQRGRFARQLHTAKAGAPGGWRRQRSPPVCARCSLRSPGVHHCWWLLH